jgi:hypothetical protein
MDFGPISAADDFELACTALTASRSHANGSVWQPLCLESVHRWLPRHPTLAAIDIVCAARFLVPLVQPLEEPAEIATVNIVFLESRKTLQALFPDPAKYRVRGKIKERCHLFHGVSVIPAYPA